MDGLSARIANKAIGNEDNDAVIEFTYASAEFETETDVLLAYSGDGGTLKCAGLKLPADRGVAAQRCAAVAVVGGD